MSKLHYRGKRFSEISPSALAEAEFESLLVQNSEIIGTNAVMLPFKKTVHSPEGSARADLAMISRDYRQWFVIEVELSGHSLYHHVIPQVRILRDATYGQDCVQYLSQKCSALDADRLAEMMRGDPPEVIVIVNKPNQEWKKELRRNGVHMLVFEIYRSQLNESIFSIDGELPRLANNFVSELSFGLLPRWLSLGSPAALSVKAGEQFPVLFDGQITYWERFNTATGAYITPVRGLPLRPGEKYALTRDPNGDLAILPLKNTKKGWSYGNTT